MTFSGSRMAFPEFASLLAAFLLLLFGPSTGKYIGAEESQQTKPVLKCFVEGMNATPGDAVTFRCTVTPTTSLRYCEFRPPWGGSPILLEDGINTLVGSDEGHDRNPANSSDTTGEEIVSTTDGAVPTTAGHGANLNRTRRSHRGRFYGWSTRLDYVGKGIANGDCSAAIKKVSLEDAGMWRCVAGIEEQMVELSVETDLVVHEGSSLPLKTHVDVSDDWTWATLTCHTTSHRPLRFCRFVRVDGTPLVSSSNGNVPGPGLNVEAGLKYGRFIYNGNGLSGGDCGLTISPLSEVDAGDWMCVLGVSGEDGHQKGILSLKPPPPSLPGGLTLGAILGIGLVSAFVLFVIVHEVIERRVSWREKRMQKKRNAKIAKADILNQNFSNKGKF